MNSETVEKLLQDVEVARILGVEPDTLRAWRRQGRGPAFIEVGSKTVRYRAEDVRAWIQAQRRGGGAL